MSNLTVVEAMPLPEAVEKVVCTGDLTPLNPEQRVMYYKARCAAVGLDWRTEPFQYIILNGKLKLYASKTATEQLASNRQITLQIISRDNAAGCYVVTCRATEPTGRFTESIGAVAIDGLRGEALCNALMKAETKSKRRAILSLTGLGMLDETELETVPGAAPITAEQAHTQQSPIPSEIVNWRGRFAWYCGKFHIPTRDAPTYLAFASRMAAEAVTKDSPQSLWQEAVTPLQIAYEAAADGEIPLTDKGWLLNKAEDIANRPIGCLSDLKPEEWLHLAHFFQKGEMPNTPTELQVVTGGAGEPMPPTEFPDKGSVVAEGTGV